MKPGVTVDVGSGPGNDIVFIDLVRSVAVFDLDEGDDQMNRRDHEE